MKKKLLALVAATVGALAFAMPAMAHNSSITITCTNVTIAYTGFSNNKAHQSNYAISGAASAAGVFNWTGSSGTLNVPITVYGNGTVNVSTSWDNLTNEDGSKSEAETLACGGQPGPAGPPGQDGQDGEDGQDGQNGQNGQNGQDGPQGPEGPQGPQGPQGPAGPGGESGSAGLNGTPGAPGVSGTPGSSGSSGENGAKGDKGDKGDKGPTGPSGAPGAAGADADICPNLNGAQSKAPAGTVLTLNPRGQMVCVSAERASAWQKARQGARGANGKPGKTSKCQCTCPKHAKAKAAKKSGVLGKSARLPHTP